MAKRLAICDTCPEKEQLTSTGRVVLQLMNEEANTFRCGVCHCPLGALTAHPSNRCKLSKWVEAGQESYY